MIEKHRFLFLLLTISVEGKEKGVILALIMLVQKKMKKKKELSQIAEEAEEEESIIQPIYEVIKKYPEKTTEEIYQILNK